MHSRTALALVLLLTGSSPALASLKKSKHPAKPAAKTAEEAEAPPDERAAHHLVWGIKLHDVEGTAINFYTRVLGRRGFVALNLIDDPERIATSKTEALALLKATTFASGARYEDFDKKTDKIA